MLSLERVGTTQRVVEVTDREGIINYSIDTIVTASSRIGVPIGSMALGDEFKFDNGTPLELIEKVTAQTLVNREIQQVRTSAPTGFEVKGLVRPTYVIHI